MCGRGPLKMPASRKWHQRKKGPSHSFQRRLTRLERQNERVGAGSSSFRDRHRSRFAAGPAEWIGL
jgi:hypothetical protein